MKPRRVTGNDFVSVRGPPAPVLPRSLTVKVTVSEPVTSATAPEVYCAPDRTAFTAPIVPSMVTDPVPLPVTVTEVVDTLRTPPKALKVTRTGPKLSSTSSVVASTLSGSSTRSPGILCGSVSTAIRDGGTVATGGSFWGEMVILKVCSSSTPPPESEIFASKLSNSVSEPSWVYDRRLLLSSAIVNLLPTPSCLAPRVR